MRITIAHFLVSVAFFQCYIAAVLAFCEVCDLIGVVTYAVNIANAPGYIACIVTRSHAYFVAAWPWEGEVLWTVVIVSGVRHGIHWQIGTEIAVSAASISSLKVVDELLRDRGTHGVSLVPKLCADARITASGIAQNTTQAIAALGPPPCFSRIVPIQNERAHCDATALVEKKIGVRTTPVQVE